MGASASLQLSHPDVGQSLSDRERQLMHSMIEESHHSCASAPDIVLPWETPALAMVFGEPNRPVVPPVRPVVGYVEPHHEGTRSEQAVDVRPRATAFEHAISFNSKRTCHLPESEQFLLLIQKWEAVISIDCRAFDLGVDVESLPYEERLSVVRDVLGGKAVATVRQRLSQLSQYIKWATGEAMRPPFPVTSELIKNYVRHLRNNGATFSKYTGLVEALKFSKYVVGLTCDLEAFKSAWVSGIMRTAAQTRPLRRQSTVLTVEALLFLESFLENQQAVGVDRYAAGVILFATYSRARFGDLRSISYVLVDEVPPNNEESIGFLEMHSASHKMRATGNRLGSHLPLVAPLKGLGPTAWGKTFIKVGKDVGLDMDNWNPFSPLLPAPDQLGAWTDRPTTSGETNRWIKQILSTSKFDSSNFTPHGCKATTLAMLSKYGAETDVRLALGHHQIRKGAAEVYARDTQSAPLRVLETMFRDIRKGHFQPDQSRSGMFRKDLHATEEPNGQTLVTDTPLPAREETYSPGSLADSWNLETAGVTTTPADPEMSEAVDTVWNLEAVAEPELSEAVDTISCNSDESESSTDSEADSCATETLEEQAQGIPEVRPPYKRTCPRCSSTKSPKWFTIYHGWAHRSRVADS